MLKLLRLTITAAIVCTLTFVGVARATASHGMAAAPAAPAGKVAFENPETFTGRWVLDHKDFTAAMKKLDPNIQVIYHNSNANITTQAQNVNADIAAGVKVIVLAAVDQNQDAPLVNKAERAGIKVLAYDRMIQSPKLRAYDSFDNVQVGVEQGKWLASHLKMGTSSSPTNVIEIRGSSTDHNAALFYQGYNSQMSAVYKTGKVKLGFFKWTPNWDDPTAGQETDQALTLLNGKPLAGVYSMNDAMAATVYASLARHHQTGVALTGQDAQPDGLGRILMHQQGMTVFKNVKLEADSAARVAYNWVAGKGLPSNYKKNCGVGCAQSSGRHVPAALFKPVAITLHNVAVPVLAGYDTWHDVCASISKPNKPFCGLPH
jgi:D-xylose transport system substrate-binding protein